MATSDKENLTDMGLLIVEDVNNTLDAIEKMRHELERWREGFSTAEALGILRDLSETKAKFVKQVQEIINRPEPESGVADDA